MRLELVDGQSVILREIADKAMKRKDVALTYALILRSREKVDWLAINTAIIQRWSKSGLIWIKEQAWKQVNP